MEGRRRDGVFFPSVPEKFPDAPVKADEFVKTFKGLMERLDKSQEDISQNPDTFKEIDIASCLEGIRAPTLSEEIEEKIRVEMKNYEAKLDFESRMRIEMLRRSKNQNKRRVSRFPCRINWVDFEDPSKNHFSEVNALKRRRQQTVLRTYELAVDNNCCKFRKPFVPTNHSSDQHAVIRRLVERHRALARETAAAEKAASASTKGEEDAKCSGSDVAAGECSSADHHLAAGIAAEEFTKFEEEEAVGSKNIDDAASNAGGNGGKSRSSSGVVKGDEEEEEAEEREDELLKQQPGSKRRRGPGALGQAIAEGKELAMVDEGEAIVSVTFYHPVRGMKVAEFDVLGSQTLADLKDSFFCDEDVNFGGASYRGSCFLLGGVLYGDTRDKSSPDYALWLSDYLASKAPQRVKQRTPQTMQNTRIDSIVLHLNQRGAYLHQGDCEHRVIISAVRAYDRRRDLPWRDLYPLRVFEPTTKATLCQVCTVAMADKLIFNASLLPSNPTYICLTCADYILFDEEGHPINGDDFLIFDYEDVV